MRSKIAKVAQLPLADWLLLLRAGLWMLCADVGLRLFGLPRTQALMRYGVRGLAPRPKAATAPPGNDEVARLSYLTDVAARHHVYPMACLPRSLALQRLLARAGIDTDLRIGVRREGRRLLAHAWVERQGRPLGEARDPALSFAALDRYPSASR